MTRVSETPLWFEFGTRPGPNIAFHGTPTRALRGSGPVNSNR